MYMNAAIKYCTCIISFISRHVIRHVLYMYVPLCNDCGCIFLSMLWYLYMHLYTIIILGVSSGHMFVYFIHNEICAFIHNVIIVVASPDVCYCTIYMMMYMYVHLCTT